MGIGSTSLDLRIVRRERNEGGRGMARHRMCTGHVVRICRTVRNMHNDIHVHVLVVNVSAPSDKLWRNSLTFWRSQPRTATGTLNEERSRDESSY